MPDRPAAESPSKLLARHGLTPRRSLGQSFLHEKSYLERIVGAAEISPSDLILEVGPGTGSLTRALAETGANVVAIELDNSLYAVLRDELGANSGIRLAQGNALSFDPCAGLEQPYKLVANIPYYITGHLIRHFLESACPPSLLVLMVQREVADRIVAKPG